MISEDPVERYRSIVRLFSGKKTVKEFNWDNIQGPPVTAFFTPNDIFQLNQIATAPRLSAKPEEKIRLMDEFMKPKGFLRFGSGTNRIVYRYVEDDTFLAKIAYNNPGRGDSPKEMVIQNILKPYVSKIFDVTPCGTLAMVERCERITNREQFNSFLYNYYWLVNNVLLGGLYVMDDIGVDTFMNFSIRKGFGLVIHDFPYLYRVDPAKLICSHPLSSTSTERTLSGTCEGRLDYDIGYNKIICTKCGSVYKASKIGKPIFDFDLSKNKIVANSFGIKKPFRFTIEGFSNASGENVSKSVELDADRVRKIIPAGKSIISALDV